MISQTATIGVGSIFAALLLSEIVMTFLAIVLNNTQPTLSLNQPPAYRTLAQ